MDHVPAKLGHHSVFSDKIGKVCLIPAYNRLSVLVLLQPLSSKFVYMTIEEATNLLCENLRQFYEAGEAAAITSLAMERICGLSRVDRFLRRNNPLSYQQEQNLESMKHELMKHRPVQYVL